MTESTMEGRCLCGSVTVTTPAQHNVEACHCSMCRRWGGPFLAIHAGHEARFDSEQHIRRFASSEWAERGFCSQCGSHLFYYLKEPGIYILSAGLFAEQGDFQLHGQVFIDHKPGFYDFANDTITLTEAQVFAQFGAD